MNDALTEIKRIVKEAGSQQKAAKRLGITPQYLGDILLKRRPISENVANKIGFAWTLAENPRSKRT